MLGLMVNSVFNFLWTCQNCFPIILTCDVSYFADNKHFFSVGLYCVLTNTKENFENSSQINRKAYLILGYCKYVLSCEIKVDVIFTTFCCLIDLWVFSFEFDISILEFISKTQQMRKIRKSLKRKNNNIS